MSNIYSVCTNNVITTHTIVFMRLKIKLLGQREDLVVLLQECLTVFKLVEIFGLWRKQRKWVLLSTTCIFLCWYSDHHGLRKWNMIAIIHCLYKHTTVVLDNFKGATQLDIASNIQAPNKVIYTLAGNYYRKLTRPVCQSWLCYTVLVT